MPDSPAHIPFLEDEEVEYSTASAAILPLPFERTTSYGKGTNKGPEAILRASHYVELWDEEVSSDPSRVGITTLRPFEPAQEDLGAALDEIRREATRHLDAGKFLISLGGEHSLSAPLVAAAAGAEANRDEPLAVVQFDAHADLRDEYEGTPHSHAAVMKRVFDAGHPTLAVGIRSLSTPEAELVRGEALPVIWGYELDDSDNAVESFSKQLDLLPEKVYLTFDIDYFDPSLVPATGTPEPGGGLWWPTLRMLRELFRRKTVVAMDLVELAPMEVHRASDFLAAKLAYKCIAYWQESRG